MRICPSCSKVYETDVLFCAQDGEKLIETDEPDRPVAGGARRTEDPLLGTILDGRYLLKERIGKGGMGKVYRSEHLGTGREVAVKVLHLHLVDDATVIARFRREARTPARIGDPGVVEVLDAGEQPGVGVYYAMELIPGQSLIAEMKSRGPFAAPELRQIFGPILRTLARAHEVQVVHRDLKPDNVLLVHESDGVKVKILDFGIAGLLSMEGEEATQLTQTGTVVGTPAFMSPEQAMGQRVGPASDIYSMGVMLFWAATGKVPFNGATPLAVLQQHLTAAVHSLGELAPALAPALDPIIARAMAKDPAKRFAHAEEMRLALEQALDGLAIVPATREQAIAPATREQAIVPAPREQAIVPAPREQPPLLTGQAAAAAREQRPLPTAAGASLAAAGSLLSASAWPAPAPPPSLDASGTGELPWPGPLPPPGRRRRTHRLALAAAAGLLLCGAGVAAWTLLPGPRAPGPLDRVAPLDPQAAPLDPQAAPQAVPGPDPADGQPPEQVAGATLPRADDAAPPADGPSDPEPAGRVTTDELAAPAEPDGPSVVKASPATARATSPTAGAGKKPPVPRDDVRPQPRPTPRKTQAAAPGAESESPGAGPVAERSSPPPAARTAEAETTASAAAVARPPAPASGGTTASPPAAPVLGLLEVHPFPSGTLEIYQGTRKLHQGMTPYKASLPPGTYRLVLTRPLSGRQSEKTVTITGGATVDVRTY